MKGTNKILSNIFCPKHPNQKLNLICIQKTCPQSGLLCNQCKGKMYENITVHSKHLYNVVPFKAVIQSLQLNSRETFKDIIKIQEQNCMKQMQNLHVQCLGRLKLGVQELSRMVQQLEQNIINRFEYRRDDCYNKVKLAIILENVVEKSMVHNLKKSQVFELVNDIQVISKKIEEKEGVGAKFRYFLNANLSETKNAIKINNIVVQQKIDGFLEYFQQIININNSDVLKKMRQDVNLTLKKGIQQVLINHEKMEKKTCAEIRRKERQFLDQYEKKEKKHQKKVKKIEENIKLQISKSQIKSQNKSQIKGEVYGEKKYDQFMQNLQKQIKNPDSSIKELKSKKNNIFSSDEQSQLKQATIKSKIKHPKQTPFLCNQQHISQSRLAIKSTSRSVRKYNNDLHSVVLLKNKIVFGQTNAVGLKIRRVEGEVRVGICFKSMILKSQFIFKNSACVMLSSNAHFYGYKQEMGLDNLFSFADKDVINVVLTKDKLYFEKGNKNNKSNTSTAFLDVKFTAEQYNDLCFGVYLNSKSDSVQIL